MRKLTADEVRKRLDNARNTINLGAGSMLGDTSNLDTKAVELALRRMIEVSASK